MTMSHHVRPNSQSSYAHPHYNEQGLMTGETEIHNLTYCVLTDYHACMASYKGLKWLWKQPDAHLRHHRRPKVKPQSFKEQPILQKPQTVFAYIFYKITSSVRTFQSFKIYCMQRNSSCSRKQFILVKDYTFTFVKSSHL